MALLSVEEQERVIAEHRGRISEPQEEFPVRPVRNRELRNQRIREQASNTPEKETEVRQRSVSVGYEDAKADARLYLQEQYTNDNGVMFCQVCNAPLSFRLPDGHHYFEAVESVCDLGKRFRETFLALCPNHAAMYQHVNEDKDNMQDLLEVAAGKEVEVTLAGNPVSIVFTEAHIADIKACLESLELESDPPL